MPPIATIPARHQNHLLSLISPSRVRPALTLIGGLAVVVRTGSERPWKTSQMDVDLAFIGPIKQLEAMEQFLGTDPETPQRRRLHPELTPGISTERALRLRADRKAQDGFGLKNKEGAYVEVMAIDLDRPSEGRYFLGSPNLEILKLACSTSEQLEFAIPHSGLSEILSRMGRPAKTISLHVAQTGPLMLSKLLTRKVNPLNPFTTKSREQSLLDVKALIDNGAADNLITVLNLTPPTPTLSKVIIQLLADLPRELSENGITVNIEDMSKLHKIQRDLESKLDLTNQNELSSSSPSTTLTQDRPAPTQGNYTPAGASTTHDPESHETTPTRAVASRVSGRGL